MKDKLLKDDEIKAAVREGYAQIAEGDSGCCGSTKSCGCGGSSAKTISKGIGYSDEDLKAIPEDANLGLGCGNPLAYSSIKAGDTVLDLGSGAGMDCFLAAKYVGPNGHVIGVDMTPEMIFKARKNASKGGYANVEFRLGEIEHMPVDAGTVDLVISNCVINLVPDKLQAFKETYRVLKPGGKISVSDIVLKKPLPDAIMKSVRAYVGCLSGALLKDEYIAAIRQAGFSEIEIVEEKTFDLDYMENDPTAAAIAKGTGLDRESLNRQVKDTVASIKVSAIKR